MKFLRNSARFAGWTGVWGITAVVGCMFLALETYASEVVANAFLQGNLRVPMSRPLAIFFGISIDLMSLTCLVGFVCFGVWCMKKIGDAFTREFPAPNFLTEFF